MSIIIKKSTGCFNLVPLALSEGAYLVENCPVLLWLSILPVSPYCAVQSQCNQPSAILAVSDPDWLRQVPFKTTGRVEVDAAALSDWPGVGVGVLLLFHQWPSRFIYFFNHFCVNLLTMNTKKVKITEGAERKVIPVINKAVLLKARNGITVTPGQTEGDGAADGDADSGGASAA